jgi:hypothetical protein
MTTGTSTHGEGLSRYWADVGQNGRGRRQSRETGRRPSARRPAPLELLALSAVAGLAAGLTMTTAWHAVADLGPHLAVLLAVSALAACVGLRPRGAVRAPRQEEAVSETPCRLLAQMHHDLRTPLNAVIGFSEAMQRELHGPLGNARYQEYAAHITESGGRLLKASEDALAVAATMSALLADRRALRRERLPVARLLQEAWAALGASDRAIRLSVEGCGGDEVESDREATRQALQHLLGEAIACAAPGGAITARTVDNRGVACIEISVEPSKPAHSRSSHRPLGPAFANDCLRLILARSLIEMQGATLNLRVGHEQWSASVAFPVAQGRRTPLRVHRPSAAARPASSARRVDLAVAPAVAAHATGQIRAAPPA